jgi:DMSO reductase anchor subunit
MHPEISLVLLLVLAGAGQGIFIFLVLLDMLFQLSGGMPAPLIYISGISSLLLTGAGMAASMFHLGNPQRGWKAILKWKSSWLSREALFMGLFSGSALLYLAAFYAGLPFQMRFLIGLIGIFNALGLYLSSAMLYAKIRFIREWSNVFTVMNFILMGTVSGGAVMFAILRAYGISIPIFNYLLILIAIASMTSKFLTYRYNAKLYMPVRAKHALALNDPDIRLMSTGTSYDHYNTKEYYHPMSQEQSGRQQAFVVVSSFIIPIGLWIFINGNPELHIGALLAIAAAVSVIAGLMIERRLFFIQGNHIQNLYYEKFKYNDAKNPILSRAKKGTPAPVK